MEDEIIYLCMERGIEIRFYYEWIINGLAIEMKKGNYKIRRDITLEEMPIFRMGIKTRDILMEMVKIMDKETGQ